MTVFHADPLGTTTMVCTTLTLPETVDDKDARSSTVVALASSLTSSMARPESTYIYLSNRYIDSLSDTELVEMEQKLEKKEAEMLISLEQPKVYQKTKQL